MVYFMENPKQKTGWFGESDYQPVDLGAISLFSATHTKV